MSASLDERIGRAASAYNFAARQRTRLEKRAGRAADADLSGELSDAVDAFAKDDWSEYSLEEIAKAAGKIERIARMMIAAEKIPAAKAEQLELGKAYRELRAEASS